MLCVLCHVPPALTEHILETDWSDVVTQLTLRGQLLCSHVGIGNSISSNN